MAFTMETIEAPAIPASRQSGPVEFDLPVREFTGYDPKGQTDITGQPIVRSAPNEKQEITNEEPEKEPKEESVSLSPRLTALARKDQAQRRRDQELTQREKALEEKLAKAEKYDQLTTKIQAKDYSAAEELGLTYEEFVQHELNKKEVDPNEARQRKLEEEIRDLKKSREEDTVKEYEANQKLWRDEISKLVNSDDKFSTIKELKMEDAVLRHVNDSFEEDGVELTAEQAAQEIEDALVERAEKFASVTKIKSKFEAPAKLGPPKTPPKTITQNMTVTPQKQTVKPFHLMSESEQIAEAYRRVQAAKLQR